MPTYQRIGKRIPMRLRTRVALVFGIITCVLVVVICFLAGRVFTDHLQNIIRLSSDQVAHRTSDGLNNSLNQRLAGIDELAVHIQNEPSAPHFQDSLELFAKLYSDVGWVALTDANGLIIASTDRQQLGTNIANRLFFSNAQALSGEADGIAIGNKKRSLISTDRSEIGIAAYLSSPLMDKASKFKGVLVAKIDAEHLNMLLTRIVATDELNNFRPILIDDTDHVLVGPAALLGQHLELASTDSSSGSANTMAQTETGDRLSLSLATPQPTQPLNQMNLRLMILQDSNQLFEPVWQSWQALALWASGIIVLVGVSYWFLAAFVIQPIVDITQVADRMRQGETRLTISEHSDFSEVAMLSTSLNTLVSGLAAKEDELRSLNDTLNHRVQERTLELVLITDSLQNEITQRRELQQQHEQLMAELLAMASIDPLTRTFNRGTIFKLAEEEYNRAHRTNTPLSIIMLDLDRFKHVNDTFGHAVGDEVLVKVSDNFRKVTRDSDLIGRYGGEEFVFILPGTDEAGAMLVAERLCESVHKAGQSTSIADQWELTASMGIAVLNMYVPDLPTLIKRADDATYAAKHNGRNRTEVAH